MSKYDLVDKPHCIYNVDEKGACPDKTPYLRGPSVCWKCCWYADTTFSSLFRTRMRSELLDNCTAGCDGCVSESGWSNTEIFKMYIKHHFMKYVQGLSSDHKILIIYDGHKSHVSLELIDWAKEHNIVLFVLPAHTSHLFHPLDVGCFRPLNRILNNSIHSYMRLNKQQLGSLASKAYVQALSAENLKSAFRKTGIYPLDAKVIDPQVLMPSTINCNKENVQQFPLKNTLLWTLIKEMKIILWLTQMIIINFAK
ncbi:hypothetical protein KUTeg_018740 [Tegillarca granosa]|uniref:DDE-1 domain-containing protein n=1 Tax=Tegillarca granosa TaxID=220873 RepID=A0ABQ9EEI2_TEGGR|nr:hypothetical protein KUTeg_018740 [Tegillarca granosa]